MEAMMDPVKVLLVDDEPLVRAGLKAILGGAPAVDVGARIRAMF